MEIFIPLDIHVVLRHVPCCVNIRLYLLKLFSGFLSAKMHTLSVRTRPTNSDIQTTNTVKLHTNIQRIKTFVQKPMRAKTYKIKQKLILCATTFDGSSSCGAKRDESVKALAPAKSRSTTTSHGHCSIVYIDVDSNSNTSIVYNMLRFIKIRKKCNP